MGGTQRNKISFRFLPTGLGAPLYHSSIHRLNVKHRAKLFSASCFCHRLTFWQSFVLLQEFELNQKLLKIIPKIIKYIY